MAKGTKEITVCDMDGCEEEASYQCVRCKLDICYRHTWVVQCLRTFGAFTLLSSSDTPAPNLCVTCKDVLLAGLLVEKKA